MASSTAAEFASFRSQELPAPDLGTTLPPIVFTATDTGTPPSVKAPLLYALGRPPSSGSVNSSLRGGVDAESQTHEMHSTHKDTLIHGAGHSKLRHGKLTEVAHISIVEATIPGVESPVSITPILPTPDFSSDVIKKRVARLVAQSLQKGVHPLLLHILAFVDAGEGPSLVTLSVQVEDSRSYLAEDRLGVDRLMLTMDVAEGLMYLHSCGIVHSDLQPSNVAINKDGRAMVRGFGIAAIIGSAKALALYSPRYSAPELLQGTKHNFQTDIFSLAGVILFTMTGKPPYVLIEHETAIILAQSRHLLPSREGYPNIEDWFWDFLMHGWDLNPAKRLTMDEIRRTMFPMSAEASPRSLLGQLTIRFPGLFGKHRDIGGARSEDRPILFGQVISRRDYASSRPSGGVTPSQVQNEPPTPLRLILALIEKYVLRAMAYTIWTVESVLQQDREPSVPAARVHGVALAPPPGSMADPHLPRRTLLAGALLFTLCFLCASLVLAFLWRTYFTGFKEMSLETIGLLATLAVSFLSHAFIFTQVMKNPEAEKNIQITERRIKATFGWEKADELGTRPNVVNVVCAPERSRSGLRAGTGSPS